MMQDWNIDKSRMEKQQAELKEKMRFSYVGNGPKSTGLFAKEFKRKPGLYARCTTCGYYMPLDARGEERCICGNLKRTEREFKYELPAAEIEIFKGVQK
jgi:hypothetical protein